MSAITGILLDKDGTLLDFNAAWLSAFQTAAAYLHTKFARATESGKCATPAELLAAGGFIAATQTWQADSTIAAGSITEVLQQWENMLGARFDAECRREIDAMFAAAARYTPTTPAMPAVLRELHTRGYTLGVATMDTAAGAHLMLRHFKLTECVDFVCGADSGFGVKPSAGMARAFCEQCGLQPAQIAVVGDTRHDLLMGRNAEAGRVVGVLSGASAAADLAPYADTLIADVGALPDILT